MVSVSLKLVVNQESNKVLFAEAGKDFVDVLCSFLTFPLATIARLVQKESSMGAVTVGCLNSLYQSVEENFNSENLPSKESILRGRSNWSESYCRALTLNIDNSERKKYFICPNMKNDCNNHNWLSTCRSQRCKCGNLLDFEVSVQDFHQGFVKSDSSIVITDDLTLVPTSTDYTTFAMLQSLGVKSTRSLKEIAIDVTKEKVLDLLKCSLLSESTLTDLFLGKAPPLSKFPKFSPCRGGVKGSRSTVTPINLKLVIRKSDRKIMYAEGDEDFAKLLLRSLTFPLGAVIRMLGGNSSLGSVDGLYKSIADLNANKYLMSEQVKNKLVVPVLDSPQYFCWYKRDTLRESFTHPSSLCVTDQEPKREDLKGHGGFIRMSLVCPELCAPARGTYFVTDDLVVTPVSPISAIYLLDRLETPLCDLEEKAVTIGMKEFLNILKASLTTTSALSNGLSHLLAETKEENRQPFNKLNGNIIIFCISILALFVQLSVLSYREY